MIDLYYWTTPNGHKITLFLEEAGLPYRIVPINIGKGEQFQPDFLKIAPNNRIPAIVDNAPADGGEPVSIFESGAILQYLGRKTGKFYPQDERGRVEVDVRSGDGGERLRDFRPHQGSLAERQHANNAVAGTPHNGVRQIVAGTCL